MQYQSRKQVWTSGVIVLSASAIAVLVWALVWPVPDWQAQAKKNLQNSNSSQEGGASKGADPNARQQEAERVDWSRRLRWPQEPVTQNEKKTKTESVTPAQWSRFQLLGTIVEEGHSFAMIQDQAGNVDLQPEGGVLKLSPQGTKVAEVKSKSVVLVKNNQRTELRMTVRTTTATETEAGRAAGAMAEEAIDAMDEEPVFNSLEEELDWLNGDDSAPDEFDETKDATDEESSLSPKREGRSR